MSKVSEAVKAQRKQHRQDHGTDADRALNGGGRKARRAARQENFNAQGNKSAADFNFDQHGKGHVGGQEISHLMQQGHSKDDIMTAAKASGGEIGKRAQKRFDRWDARAAAKGKAQAAKDNPAPTSTSTTTDSYNTETEDNTNTQNVNNSTNTNVNQDNDIVNDISGDNNNVSNKQDNSVNTMGGSSNTGSSQNSGVGSNGSGSGQMNHAAVMPKDYKEHPMPGSSSVTDGSYNSSTGSNSSGQDVDGSTNLNANQDNDIANNVSGDDNYIYNRQDNSIRNYGGDTRVFNYQSSGQSPEFDSPVSAATMGGYYDVDDSPGAQAGRLDRNITMANDYAKDNMDTDWIAQGAKKKAEQGSYIDPAALDARIRAREAASFAKSKQNESDMWGDMDSYSWGGVGETPDPVEKPDYEGIGNSYTDY